eukprot:CAMPEP_0167752554 /NCGR_PEP_ID=MMETSP0110_2-20121227/7207_1 /TAXON_ID=629695 /ORGANISM="Gymnochlora sp., Strain CCMP2014" /LENGTH=323 /DNA_ID=CAMNT_0007638191 /DNA_START=425 /DNA_END=1396 /DNA_ORIENTATION=-
MTARKALHRKRRSDRIYDFFFAGLAPSLSILATSPVDVVKARMQTAGEGQCNQSIRTRDVLMRIVREEGLAGCYRGIGISVLREASLNVMRLGLFDPIMSFMHHGYRDVASTAETGLPPLYKRLLCGSICGIVGSLAANPMELVKCRIQCAGKSATSSHMYNYSGTVDAFSQIIKHEGIAGLWNGSQVFAIRNAFGSAANLSTFTALKAYILQFRKDSVGVDIVAGLGSGFVTTCVMCPLDMLKTRVQNQPIDHNGMGTLYNGTIDAALKIRRTEGISAFYKGFTSLFIRTGPHYILTFAIFGMLRRYAETTGSQPPTIIGDS